MLFPITLFLFYWYLAMCLFRHNYYRTKHIAYPNAVAAFAVAITLCPNNAHAAAAQKPPQSASRVSIPILVPHAVSATVVSATEATPVANMAPAAIPVSFNVPWDANVQGNFIMSMTGDRQGHVWVGTEDQGVWRFDRTAPAGKQWTQFNSTNGLGDDDCYALACDEAGRIWAGTLNHGVSVYNGKTWKTYGPLDGPLGSRVFALAVSPKGGGVWGATEAGLFRYRANAWTYYTRAEGLPSDQAQALAFAPDGTLYVGTQCDGVAIGSPGNDYKTWRVVTGPECASNQGRGSGLPISQINALLVTRSGSVYCGTTAGLACSGDHGKTWRFWRGADWLDKGSGLYGSGLVQEAKISGIEVLPLTHGSQAPAGKGLAVNAAGGALDRFAAAQGFAGGGVFTSPDTVDTKSVAGAAPPALYQSERWGNCSFTASGLKPLESYQIRLHLAEVSQTAPGKRIFNVFADGRPVLTHLDVFQAAGGQNKALVKEFVARADRIGQIVVQFQGAAPSGVDTGGGKELAEDYVSSLAEDAAGHLLVGHRQKGLEVWDVTREVRLLSGPSNGPASDYVFALLPLSDGGVLIGKYGGGLARGDVPGLSPLNPLKATAAPAVKVASVPAASPFPLPAKPPTLAQLQAMLARVKGLKGEMPGDVAFIGDDWETAGDWVGRYGRQHAILWATSAPFNDEYATAGDNLYQVTGQIGPNHHPGDDIRHWVHWLRTNNPNTLYNPEVGGRRQAEVDDHSEVYPMTQEGTDLWFTVQVPQGVHRVSFYFFNKDAAEADNSLRDYFIELKSFLQKSSDDPEERRGLSPPRVTGTLADLDAAMRAPTLAQARVRDFHGGVYKQFLVVGPSKVLVRVAKNNSKNTICSGTFIDALTGPELQMNGKPMGAMGGLYYNAPEPKVTVARINGAEDDDADGEASLSPDLFPRPLQVPYRLWTAMDGAYPYSGSLLMQHSYRLFALRAARLQVTGLDTQALLANWRWTLTLWDDPQRLQYQQAMAKAWNQFQDLNKELASHTHIYQAKQ